MNFTLIYQYIIVIQMISHAVERVRERERNACQVMDDRMVSNPRRLLRHAQCLFPHLPNHVTETAFEMFWRNSH